MLNSKKEDGRINDCIDCEYAAIYDSPSCDYRSTCCELIQEELGASYRKDESPFPVSIPEWCPQGYHL